MSEFKYVRLEMSIKAAISMGDIVPSGSLQVSSDYKKNDNNDE